MHLTILFLHPRSSNLQYVFQQYIQWRICCSGNVDVLHRNRKCFFSWHVQFDLEYNVMTINASSSHRVESSWIGVGKCNSSDFPWISCSSPRSGRSRVKVDVLRRCSHPKILTVPSATGNMKFPLLRGVNTYFALSLRAWSSDASTCSNSSVSATKMSPFQIPPAYNA